ncbi:25S rRNA (adenine2142-N1)-methyltransferase [Sorochytrium milnesiophthora]
MRTRRKRVAVTAAAQTADKGSHKKGAGGKRKRTARAVITGFHNLTKGQPDRETPPIIDQDQLDVYQKASLKIKSTSFTSRNLVANLPASASKLSLLDVGALEGPEAYRQAQRAGKLEKVVSIDLRPQSVHVKQCDFFLYPLRDQQQDRFVEYAFDRPSGTDDSTEDAADLPHLFDIVSLSLVVNFLPTPQARGAMLQKAVMHLAPQGARLLYIVLPLACMDNARYNTEQHFVNVIMHSLGCTPVDVKRTSKLWCALFQAAPDARQLKPVAKQLLADGPSRNNFTTYDNTVPPPPLPALSASLARIPVPQAVLLSPYEERLLDSNRERCQQLSQLFIPAFRHARYTPLTLYSLLVVVEPSEWLVFFPALTVDEFYALPQPKQTQRVLFLLQEWACLYRKLSYVCPVWVRVVDGDDSASAMVLSRSLIPPQYVTPAVEAVWEAGCPLVAADAQGDSGL